MEKQKRIWLSKEQKAAHLQAWHESKLSKREYCNREKISYGTFLHWIEGKDRKKTGNKKTDAFIPLEMASPVLSGSGFATMHIGRQHKIEFHQAVPAVFIKELLISCK